MVAKVKHWALFYLLMLLGLFGSTQSPYSVQYTILDSVRVQDTALLRTRFWSQADALDFLAALPQDLQRKGYITASVDEIRADSLAAHVLVFLGEKYEWASLRTRQEDEDLLAAIRWNTGQLKRTPLQFSELQRRQEQLLSYLEETGHPFARIFLDSIKVTGKEVEAYLAISRGPAYRIDSIRIVGNAAVSHRFLQRYLDLPNGSMYSKSKLAAISKKLAALLFIQEERPFDITFLATGSVLNLYLKTVRNSQVNALIGFLPNPVPGAAKSFRISGEANILLRNALGAAETIGVNAQFLQEQSPRLNLLFEYPFIFNSPFGLSFGFDMFRKDSTFLNINLRAGASFGAGEVQSGTLFFERSQSIVSGIDVQKVLASKQLPAEGDVRSAGLGIVYGYNNTDYRLNPMRGNELVLVTSAGTKGVRKNNQVLELKNPDDPAFSYDRLYDTVKLKTYQFRIAVAGAHYFKTGRQTTLKTGLQGGVFGSGKIYRNELFRIGGYKLLRGFDEESQYVSQYAVGTVEYRVLLQRNSAFFGFVDGGWARPLQGAAHRYLGTGLGISSETKAGIFNLVWALGKRDDTDFNLRQSKVHLGFVNYF